MWFLFNIITIFVNRMTVRAVGNLPCKGVMTVIEVKNALILIVRDVHYSPT